MNEVNCSPHEWPAEQIAALGDVSATRPSALTSERCWSTLPSSRDHLALFAPGVRRGRNSMSSQLTEEELAALMPSELGAASHADPDPDRVQRRILSRSAERAAARSRGAAPRHGRRPRRQAGARSPPLLPDRRRHGRVVRGDERGLWAALRGQQGGSRHARRWPKSAPTRSRTSSSWTCTRTSCATTRAS